MGRAMEVWLLLQLTAVLGASAQHVVRNPTPLTYLYDFEGRLQQAAYEVSQQEDWQYGFPEFRMPSDFMHSFIPGTGVGNREDLVIDVIRRTQVFDDISISKWRYERFNNSDYVLGVHEDNVALWRTTLTNKSPFVFESVNAIWTYYPKDERVMDSILFSRLVNHIEVLYVAVLVRSYAGDRIRINEINSEGTLVTGINLEFPIPQVSTGNKNRLAYVQSQREGALVVCLDTEGESKVVYRRQGSSTLSHYIEVHCQSPVDLVTFSVNGHGYIAVSSKTDAEVFKMDDNLKDYISFEQFPYEENIVDLEYFRLGFHHYLAIAAENYQTLYIWKTGGFFSKQEFNFPGARQWYSALLPTCRDDVILFLIQKHAAEVFIWNGQTENFTQVSHKTPDFNPLAGSITSFSYNTTAFLLFADQDDKAQMLSVETHLEPVPDPVLTAGEEVSEVMRNLREMLSEQDEQLESISAILSNAVKYSGNQTFTVRQSFVTLEVSDEISSEMKTTHLNWQNSPLTLEEFIQGTAELETKVLLMEDSVDSIEMLISDLVLLGENADITGPKTIRNFYGHSLKVDSLFIESVSGINIKRAQNEIYRLDKPQLINGQVRFGEVIVVENMDVKHTVNGLDISEEVMTVDSDQQSTASMIFPGKLNVLGNLNLTGTVNGIDISNEIVRLHENDTIVGKKVFFDGIVAENVETGVLDGVDVNELERKALTRTGDQKIEGVMSFSAALYASEINLLGLINGYNVSKIAEGLVTINKPTYIGGFKVFSSINIEDNLIVHGLIDNVDVPDDLLMPNEMQVIAGTKKFSCEVIANYVTAIGKVDGLNLPADVISLTGNETIDTTLNFVNGLTAESGITVHGLVDGVDISTLKARVLNRQNGSSELEDVIFLGPVTILNDLSVEGNLNGMPLEELVKDLVFKDDKNVVFTAPKIYRSVVAGSVSVKNKVNGYDLTEDFMFADRNQTITGVKTFKKPTKLHDVYTGDGKISGIDIAELYQKRIILSEDKPKFENIVIDGHLVVDGTVNGVKFPGDLVLKSLPQTISNTVFEGDVHFNSLIVDGNVEVSHTFSDVSLPQFFDETVSLTGNEELYGDVVLGNTTAISVKITGLVNELDIVEFAENVMSLTKNQTIIASKVFSGNVDVFGSVSTQGINGLHLADVKERAFKLHETNVVTAPFTFAHSLKVKNVTVEGNVNGINLEELISDSVKTHDIQHVTAETVFHKGFHVDGNIQADEVNGLDFFADVLTKHEPQVISGKYTFGTLTVGKNVVIDGLVNGIDLSEVDLQLVKASHQNTIESNLVFKKPVEIRHDLHVSGLINGKESNKLKKALILETGVQHITGAKTLEGSVTIYGDMNATLVNGVNWLDFLQDVVRTDIPQNVPAPKTFSNNLEVEGDIFVSDTASVGHINGISLEKFLHEAVFTDQAANITGEKVFISPVEISGELMAQLINGLNLKRDVITLQCVDEDSQVITGSKEFWNLTVMGHVIVEQFVNGYNLVDLYRDTLTTYGNQTISGYKYFKDLVTVERDVSTNTVNGLNLEDLVLLNTNQTIDSSMTFRDDVIIKGDLHILGPVNGIDLDVLSNILYTDTNQTITGSYVVDNALAVSVSVNGTVNGLDLREFFRSVNQFYEDSVSRRDTLMEISERQCQATKYLTSVAEASYYVLDGFTIHQILNYSADFIEVDAAKKELILIQALEKGSSVTALINNYDASKDQFVFSEELLTTIVNRKSFGCDRHLIMNIGAESKESFVSYNNVVLGGISGFFDGDATMRKNEVYIAVLQDGTGYCEMFTMQNISNYPSVSPVGSIFVGKEVTSLAVFNAWDEVYVAFSKFEKSSPKKSSLLYLWENGWKLVQEIPASASSKVIHFEHLNHHYIIFTNSQPVHEMLEAQYIQVYRCSGDKNYPFKLYQRIPFDSAENVEVFKLGNLPDLYLTTFNATRVQMYRLDGEAGFMQSFSLNGKCIKTVKTALIGRALFLVVSQHDKNYVESSISIIYKGITQGSAVARRELKHCP